MHYVEKVKDTALILDDRGASMQSLFIRPNQPTGVRRRGHMSINSRWSAKHGGIKSTPEGGALARPVCSYKMGGGGLAGPVHSYSKGRGA